MMVKVTSASAYERALSCLKSTDLLRLRSSIGRQVQVLPYSAATPEAHRFSPQGF
jgi:hypothetical protein